MPSIPSIPESCLFMLAAAGISAPFVYRFADDRWWFTFEGKEYWLFNDRVLENPF